MSRFKQLLRQILVVRPGHMLMGMAGFVLLFIMVSPLFVTKSFDRKVTVGPGQTQLVGPIDINAQGFGSSRLEIESQLAVQRWATYEVQLLDKDNKVMLAGVKNAWHERGTWYEDGESGTWQEQDRDSGFDLRLNQKRPVKLAISLVEVSNNRGQPLSEVVSFRVKLHERTIETLPLWFACISLVGLSIMRWESKW